MRRLRAPLEYLLALTPFVTDWVDSGHLPESPQELVTELILGGLIIAGVWRLHRELDRQRDLAETDALTGLPNRRRFQADLHREVARAQRLGTPLVLAYIDVNGFKAINDRHGHAAGDLVLQRVATMLRRGVREGVDEAYRVGGDEFAILFTNTPADEARQALRRAALPPGYGVAVEVSVGVVAHRPEEDPATFVARADRLMYSSKRGLAVDPQACLRLVAG